MMKTRMKLKKDTGSECKIQKETTDFGRPMPSATARSRGAVAMSGFQPVSVGVRTYDKCTQVEDCARWSNLKLEEEIAYRLDNLVCP